MSNVQFIESLYAAFGRGEVPVVLAAFSPSISWSEAEGNPYQPSGEAWIGPEAVLENLFMKLGTDWDGFTVTPVHYHDAGATVVVEGRYTGKNLATCKELDAQMCHVWTLADGKITRFQQFVDTAQLQSVMGS